jgi:hypothetical protein
MKQGHCTGKKRERIPRKATPDRYAKLAAALAATFAGKSTEEIAALAFKPVR